MRYIASQLLNILHESIVFGVGSYPEPRPAILLLYCERTIVYTDPYRIGWSASTSQERVSGDPLRLARIVFFQRVIHQLLQEFV